MSIEENRRILSDLHAALNSRDLDRALSLFMDDASWIVMPGGTCYSKDDIRKYLEKAYRTYEKFNLKEIHPPVVSGEMATHEFMFEVRMKGRPEATVPSVVVAEFRNGRISQLRSYIDKLEAAKQLAKGTLEKRTVATVAKRVEAAVNP